VSDLHRRAAAWFAVHDLVDLAVEHALAGEDFVAAAGLIAPIAEQLLSRGQAVTLLRWLEALPPEAFAARPALLPLKALALFLCSRPPQQVRDLLQQLSASGTQAEFQGELFTLQALLAVLQGQSTEAARLSAQALEELPPVRLFFRSLAADSLGMAHTLAGDYAAAAQAFEQVVELSEQNDNLMFTLMALSNLAGLRYAQGRLSAAIDTCRQVIELATRRLGRGTPLLGKALFTLGELLREQGDLDVALATLREAASMLESFSEVGLSIAYLAIARIYLVRQNWPAAQAHIDLARQGARAEQSTWIDDRLVETVQARYWIAHGDLAQAVQWARSHELLDRPPAEVFADAARYAGIRELRQGECLTLVRLHLARRQPDKALEMLAFLQTQPGQSRQLRRVLEVLALQALASQDKGDLDAALLALGEALVLAEPEGYQRAFLDEGEPMARLLYHALDRGLSPAYAGKLLAALSAQMTAPAPPQSGPGSALIEPLSGRELEVLRLLAEGLSNAEIAHRLYISLSTVKSHTANIFGKLGVKNRTQAVALARTLNLL